MQPTCEFCGDPVRPERPGTFQYTGGWVEFRRGGGGHSITLPERAPRWACSTCIDLRRAGIIPGQGTLL